MKAYNAVLEGFSGNPKAPAAQLRKGLALLQMNKKEAGIHELRLLIQRHPQTPEAAQARTKLNGMGVKLTGTLETASNCSREKPRVCGAFLLLLALHWNRYPRLAIRLSSADFGGRVSDSGNVASGSSTTFSRSMKVGFSVLM